MIHNTFWAWYATCKVQHAIKPSPTFFEIAVFQKWQNVHINDDHASLLAAYEVIILGVA